MFQLRRLSAALAVLTTLATATTSQASIFQGNLYFTHFTGGGPNVLSVSFTYNSTTQALSYGSQNGLATVNGADGIMFAPNGNLLVTSNNAASVYRIDASNGMLKQTVNTGNPSFSDFHMALDPSGTQFYSSNRYNRSIGPLDTFTINPNGTINNATTTNITGNDLNVTQLAFAPNGKVFYTDGLPNNNGSVGLFTFGAGNDTTTQLFPSGGTGAGGITAAHGIVYDPFTGLITMFGGGGVATLDPNQASNPAIVASLKQRNGINSDFDQGSVDGFGHAFIAGNGQITFIDYSQTGDITSAANKVIIMSTDGTGGSFGGIDDVAPLVGLGADPSSAPEPASLTLLGFGAVGMAGYSWRRRKLALTM
jgi:hypothetical protein